MPRSVVMGSKWRHRRSIALVLAGFPVLMSGCGSVKPEAPDAAAAQITGQSYRLEPAFLVNVHVPSEDVEKVLAAAVAAAGLDYGKYDQVAYLDAPGLEQYRPREGSKAGPRVAAERRPTTNLSFSLPRDPVLLKRALDAVYAAHSYEEPVVYISEVWRTRSTNPDDANPNRWWNR